MTLKSTAIALSFAATLALTGCGSDKKDPVVDPVVDPVAFVQVKDLPAADKKAKITTALTTYADAAIKGYEDALKDAKAMKTALTAFTGAPTEATLTSAKKAWLQARETYGPTEAFRLSGGPIDDEEGYAKKFGFPEGQLNAWPLNESMIDYVTAKDGSVTTGNIIDNATSPLVTFKGQDAETTTLGGSVDIATINVAMLKDFTEKDGDANVATGYHAIEFLLWGQDQDYAGGPIADGITTGNQKAGARTAADYTTAANADRRKEYLIAAADLIIEDLESMVTAWKTDYKAHLIAQGEAGLKPIFSGLGVFIKSEVANERMLVSTDGPSEEDEHSCFSDNTHRDVALNYKGFADVLAIFTANISKGEKDAVAKLEKSIQTKVDLINTTATMADGFHYDAQLNPANNKLKNITDAAYEMRDLGDEVIKVAAEYGITLSEDDVTDGEESDLPSS